MIKVKAKREGFRRAGVSFPKAGKTYPDDFFSFDQIEQLKAEPNLIVTYLPDLSKADPDPEPPLEPDPEPVDTELKTHPGTGEVMIGQEGPGVLVSDPEEEAQARDILEKMTNAKLKADCDEIGIEYPANATKAVLVDLILENTAPALEE